MEAVKTTFMEAEAEVDVVKTKSMEADAVKSKPMEAELGASGSGTF